jgi:hypothetical protein
LSTDLFHNAELAVSAPSVAPVSACHSASRFRERPRTPVAIPGPDPCSDATGPDADAVHRLGKGLDRILRVLGSVFPARETLLLVVAYDSRSAVLGHFQQRYA